MRNPDKGMTLIVKEVTRLTVGLIFLFGIYIMLHGHITPGEVSPGGSSSPCLSFTLFWLTGGNMPPRKWISSRHRPWKAWELFGFWP